MNKIKPIKITFLSKEHPDPRCLQTAYDRIFAIAKKNLIEKQAKGKTSIDSPVY